MDSNEAFSLIRKQTDDWLDSYIPDKYTESVLQNRPKKEDTKILRDGCTGYQILEPHEYLIIDHPVFQRLRYIHQTALAYLVYPTANHTRFDHSLGCMKIAQDIGERILQDDMIKLKELRIAALLHDIGHAFLSHLSETIMESHFRNIYLALKGAEEFKGLNLSLSEMMSYFIFTNEKFNKFVSEITHAYHSTFEIQNVANMIRHKPDNSLAFMGDMISGPFDVDKLDYLVRDCYFTGIRADVDVERVVVSAVKLDSSRFSEAQYPRRSLVMSMGGVSILEQITFNKMLLFPAIYHHHKIRAIECMIKSIFEAIWENDIENEKLKFESIIDFYKISEPQFFTFADTEKILQPHIRKLLNRQLLERCLVLCSNYVIGKSRWKHLAKRHYETAPKQIKWMRQAIYDNLTPESKTKLKLSDIWVDIPKSPPLGDPDKAQIDIGTTDLLGLSAFFPYPHWLIGYEVNKLKGHVFSSCDTGTRKEINESAKDFFKSNFDINFNPRATIECKV